VIELIDLKSASKRPAAPGHSHCRGEMVAASREAIKTDCTYQSPDERRGAADCGEYRETAGAAASKLIHAPVPMSAFELKTRLGCGIDTGKVGNMYVGEQRGAVAGGGPVESFACAHVIAAFKSN
jgi:hypothetical protein